MLPNIKIFFENGALRSSVPMPDGVGGAVLTGVAVAGTFALLTPYVLRNVEGLKALGVTEVRADALKMGISTAVEKKFFEYWQKMPGLQ